MELSQLKDLVAGISRHLRALQSALVLAATHGVHVTITDAVRPHEALDIHPCGKYRVGARSSHEVMTDVTLTDETELKS